ncbi:AlbA family DNA-binding domain-containing protein [Aquiflexum lacus]|uniref:AlbA family DNA-binding domain-containing protein n=1 Tax=Aquiflexum lacus TaxID=2483805 RepID=UPI0018956F17|nr:ATP-binding protein [Aquiflexum lacus]
MPKKNEERIKDLVRRPESQNLDFKLHVNNPMKLAKTLTAFANTEGGTLVIGVSDNKNLVGIDPEEEVFIVEKSAKDYCSPPVTVDYEILEHDISKDLKIKNEIMILLVHVAKSENLHYLIDDNGDMSLYKRIYDRTLPANKR